MGPPVAGQKASLLEVSYTSYSFNMTRHHTTYFNFNCTEHTRTDQIVLIHRADETIHVNHGESCGRSQQTYRIQLIDPLNRSPSLIGWHFMKGVITRGSIENTPYI